MSKVIVHIDRLVLRGMDPGATQEFATLLQAELQRRLSLPETAQKIQPGYRYRLDTGRVRIGQDSLGTATGAAVARSLTGGRKP